MNVFCSLIEIIQDQNKIYFPKEYLIEKMCTLQLDSDLQPLGETVIIPDVS